MGYGDYHVVMKIIKSPSKKWPGEVQLSDPLTFPQVLAFEDALRAVKTAKEDNLTLARANYLILPGVLACVERFNLAGLPDNISVDAFPATPRLASAQLVSWLIGEITALYNEAEEIPNA